MKAFVRNQLAGFQFKQMPRRLLLGLSAGVPGGLAVGLFLHLMAVATEIRLGHPEILWFLPIAGGAVGWLYHHFGQDIAPGNNLIIDEIHQPKKLLPLKMSPLVLIGTISTTLFGGSAGREGAAVQMGATFADQSGRLLKSTPSERRALLIAGAGAGFGAALGTPWAGLFFGMEMIHVGRLRPQAWLECLVASFAGVAVATFTQHPETQYPALTVPTPSLWLWLSVLVCGVAWGLAARAFVYLTHRVEKLQAHFVRYPPLRPVLGGFLLIAFYWLEGSYRYAGLGLPAVVESMQHASSWRDPLFKSLFTALTIGSGFKGGEFIPLVFLGATLGSFIAGLMQAPVTLLSQVGFAAVFAAASNTPLACSVMAIEIFGWPIAPYALLGCAVAYLVSGRHGIYKAQK